MHCRVGAYIGNVSMLVTYDMYERLIESIVVLVLFHFSDIWGIRTFPKIETVPKKSCGYLIGVSQMPSRNRAYIILTPLNPTFIL